MGNIQDKRLADGFDQFWAAYPKKRAKKDALKAFTQLAPNAELVAKMLDALAWQVRQPEWLKDGGQFIPYPASWLRDERWDDEPVQLPQVSERTAKSLAAIYGTH
jgi:hypothetical protein